MGDVRPGGAHFYRHERHELCVEGERIATEVCESMNHPYTASFMVLGSALQTSGDTSSRDLHYARQAYDIVMHLKNGSGDRNGVAMPTSAWLGD
jgi:hypothetical protein